MGSHIGNDGFSLYLCAKIGLIHEKTKYFAKRVHKFHLTGIGIIYGSRLIA